MTVARYDAAVAHGSDGSRSWVDLMAPAVELAKAVQSTEFVPRGIRNNPPAIAAVILYGDEVGIGPMQSLAKIASIEGRPFMAAEAQRALVLALGHELWPDELTTTRATWCGRRRGSEQVTRITWTMDDARRAGLHGKNTYRNYPRQMLSARASAELVRAVFADVVGGIAALEELDDVDALDVDANGVSPTTGTKRRRARRQTGAATVTDTRKDAPAEVLPPLPDEAVDLDDVEERARAQERVDADVDAANARLRDMSRTAAVDRDRDAWARRDSAALENAPSTRAQRNRMHGLMRARGIIDRGERLRLTHEVVGRVVGSSTDLTAAEADALLEYLESTPEPEPDAPALDVEPEPELEPEGDA
jgi:hypothetical protein